MSSVVAKKKSVVYRALCQVLSDQTDSACTEPGRSVPWSSFTPFDYHQFVAMAKTEGVAPLIHWKLKEASPPPSIPPAVRTALADSFYSNVVSNTLLFRELDRILDALNDANTCPEPGRRIPVIVLKGAALAQTLYPDPTASINSGQRLRPEINML